MGDPVYCNDGGSNTSPYETWAKAATTMATALGAVDAGGTIYVQSDHTEQFGSDTTLASTNGVAATPVTIISVTNLNEPPGVADYETMTTGGGKLDGNTGGAYDVLLTGWDIWIGLEFHAGDNFSMGAANTSVKVINSKLFIDDFFLPNLSSDTLAYLENVDVVQVTAGGFSFAGAFWWRGGSYSFGGGSVSTNLFNINTSSGRQTHVTIEGVDFQDLDADDYLVNSQSQSVQYLLKRCKIPSAVNYMDTGPTGPGNQVKFHSVDDGDNIHTFKEFYFEGKIESDAAVYLDATYDGTNGYSAKLTSNANAKEWLRPLRFKLADIYITATGKTLTVETLTDNVTLQNDEFWLEVEYPDSTTGALGNILSTKPATILTAPANLTASAKGAGDWTGESGTPVYQKVVADFTGVADEAIGVYTVWACLAKASTIVYVDPKIVVA